VHKLLVILFERPGQLGHRKRAKSDQDDRFSSWAIVVLLDRSHSSRRVLAPCPFPFLEISSASCNARE
jgi:hypothetical protein